jgi:hypothetical protein
MRLPKNIISENLYTSGNEFVDATTNALYQGYYYEINGKFYAGGTFDSKAPEIIKIKEANSLFDNISTALFSALSGISSQALLSPIIKGNPVGSGSDLLGGHGDEILFFSKQLNVNPILIKSIDEKTYLSLQGIATYQTIYIGDYKGNIITPEQAYSQMSGLKAFLGG